MSLPNLKELEAMVKMLRANGVVNYNTPELQLVLTEAQAPSDHKQTAHEMMQDLMDTDEELTEEDLIGYNDLPVVPEA